MRREKGVVVVATVFLNWLCQWVMVVVVDHSQPEIVKKGQFNPKVKRTTTELVLEKEEFEVEPSQKRRDDDFRSHHSHTSSYVHMTYRYGVTYVRTYIFIHMYPVLHTHILKVHCT